MPTKSSDGGKLLPLETLFEVHLGEPLSLPEVLENLYGRLQFPVPSGRPHIYANFVSTLDGAIALNEAGYNNPGEISGYHAPDQMVMGLLRAVSDVVIAGASAVRRPPGHIWTPEFIYPPLAAAYREIRRRLSKPKPPLIVIVTAQALIDLSLPVFQSPEVPVMVLTTPQGAARLAGFPVPASVQVIPVGAGSRLSAHAILDAVRRIQPVGRILIEGGPHMLGDFLAENVLDELFLTLAPQVAGRLDAISRPGLVAGVRFAPQSPLWGQLVNVKRGGSHLFLRYVFSTAPGSSG